MRTNISRFLAIIKVISICILTIPFMSLMLDSKASKELIEMAKIVDGLSELDSIHNIDYIDGVIKRAADEGCDTIKTFIIFNKVTCLAFFHSPSETLECL